MKKYVNMKKWEKLACADPELSVGDYMLIKLGPSTVWEWMHLQIIKLRYKNRNRILEMNSVS